MKRNTQIRTYGKSFAVISTTLIHLLSVSFALFYMPAPVVAQTLSRMSSHLTIPLTSSINLLIEKNNTTESQVALVSDNLASTKILIYQDKPISVLPEYYPYGNTLAELSQNPNNRYYTGQRKVTDVDSPVYNYNARYYSPDTGVFTQPDPAEGSNRFAYVGGNPTMRNDPSGLLMTTGGNDGGGSRKSGYIDLLSQTPQLNRNFRHSESTDTQFFRQNLVSSIYIDPNITPEQWNAKTDREDSVMQMAFTGLFTAPFVGVSALGEGLAIKQVAIAGAKNFTVGATTSGTFEALSQAALGRNIDWEQVAKTGVYGGASQTISFGLFSPERIAESRVVQALAQKVPQIATSRLGRAAMWAPALAVDSAIWAPQSMDPEKNDYAEAYGFELGLQSSFEGTIMGINHVGERMLNKHALGTKTFVGLMGITLVKNWVENVVAKRAE